MTAITMNVNDPILAADYNTGSANRTQSYVFLPLNNRRLDVNHFTKRFVLQDGSVQQEVEINPITRDVRPVGPAQQRTAGYIRSIIEWRDVAPNGERYEDLSKEELERSPIAKNVNWNIFKCSLEGGKCDRMLMESDALQIAYFDHNWLRYLVHLPLGFRLAPGQTGENPYELAYRTSGMDYLLPLQRQLVKKDDQGRYIACANPPMMIKGRIIGDNTCRNYIQVEINILTGTFSEVICNNLPNRNPYIIRQDSDLLTEEEWRMYRVVRQLEYPTRVAASAITNPITSSEMEQFQMRERERLQNDAQRQRETQKLIYNQRQQASSSNTMANGRLMPQSPIYPVASPQGVDANGNLIVQLPNNTRSHPILASVFAQTEETDACSPDAQSTVRLLDFVQYGDKLYNLPIDLSILNNVTNMKIVELAAKMPVNNTEFNQWQDWINLTKNDPVRLNVAKGVFDHTKIFIDQAQRDLSTAIEILQKRNEFLKAKSAQIQKLQSMIKDIPQPKPTPQPMITMPMTREAECVVENERLKQQLAAMQMRERETQMRNDAQSQQAFFQANLNNRNVPSTSSFTTNTQNPSVPRSNFF